MALSGGKHHSRPMPPDFPIMFPRLGWEAVEDHYQTNQRAVRRWMIEAGGEEEMIARRRAYLRKVYAARGKSRVAGRPPRGVSEMRASDPALAYMPVRRLRRRFDGEI